MTVSVKAPTSTTGSIQLNGSDVLTIDSSGNLTAPNNLTVTGTVTQTGGATFNGGISGNVAFDTDTLYVDATNNRVGIGTSSPSVKLDVSGVVGGSGSGFNPGTTAWVSAAFKGTGAYGGGISFVDGSNGATIYAGAQNLIFGNGATSGGTLERMRIDSSGNLLINSTTTTSGLPAQLFVKGNGSSGQYGIGIGYGTSALQWRVMYMNSGDGNLYFHNGNNYANLSSAGAWTNASDERLKNNIVDIKYGLDAVLNTQPRSYKMNEIAGDFIGFVAQELQTVIPEVVSGDPEVQLGVDYGSLVAVAFKAIQEQQDIIKALETRIQVLENPNG